MENKTGMGYAQYIEKKFWKNVDANKLSTVMIPEDAEFSGIFTTLPYYIRTIKYYGNNAEIIKHLNLQYDNFGTTWKRSEVFIDYLVTTKCNLACHNCTLFSQYKSMWFTADEADEDLFIKQFSKYAIKNGGKGITVKILGGEPLVLGKDRLDRLILKFNAAGFKQILLTNGIIDYTPPIEIAIEDSSKDKIIKPEFHTTLLAPIDLPEFADMDYSLGCSNATVCGYCWKLGKIYPCSGSIGIAELKNLNIGYSTIEEVDKHRVTSFNDVCKYCGTFKKLGYHNLDKSKYERSNEETLSDTWKDLKDKK